LETVTVTKIGFGVSTGVEILLDAELVTEGVGFDVDDDDLEADFDDDGGEAGVGVDDGEDEDEEALVDDTLELVGVGFGAGSTTVTVGPELTISTVFVVWITVVACGTWVDPPSTLTIA
jgi:hypothetical protein